MTKVNARAKASVYVGTRPAIHNMSLKEHFKAVDLRRCARARHRRPARPIAAGFVDFRTGGG